MLLPAGKLKNACRTVLALVCLAVAAEPIAGLMGHTFDFESLFAEESVDAGYIETTKDYFCNLYEKEVLGFLEEKGVPADSCEVSGKFEGGTFEFEKVVVKIKNGVISGSDEHIIGTVEITAMLSEALSIKKERVIVYGE